ncbi:hypothetical protein ABB37_07435 [Leptomonas pyrrhocoris]|uniref:Uncharacterized protein n=1 Tax=Leptomonas pyrrhocoris TaxID=157538 RepID=A0A0N0VE18_LEPPY|nr:hypothetical protein ABB37_07435 [Leptomonas pyrrhocoris]XP_015655563.1 hypothetical protein ABB37_07435 [Leptomonas pyrrhocoris]KPA77123.1 hypothetical protein ABB37_07435 [Leptomonas pyrrhocoris]KPA77124.1 hypothetical protein ABB37_07435 [Leptomonas pyrrhocoris]|eukprot:XP_015655562.1 hypothetical protein ABB37_07435 [Leptomonas pyrrhocoris]
MSPADHTIPFRITTYKLNFHSVNSSRERPKERILGDRLTDVWCLQGVNINKQLKSLPAAYEVVPASGLAFVHNKERVRVIYKHSVNLMLPLLAAADERPSVADSFSVSRFHLSKLKAFVGFAAYEMLPQSWPAAATASSLSPPMRAAAQRLLVVNVDFEKYRGWGDAFHCSLLSVLCREIWDGSRCLTKLWGCTHVFLAGSFFFVPGSPPYLLMTSLSGGLVEEVVAQTVVPPFERVRWEENETDAAGKAAVVTCVAAAEAQGGSRCRQLLGVQVRRGAADGPVVTLVDLHFSCLNPATGECDAEDPLTCEADGWWMLFIPRDTSNADQIVAQLEWPCDDDISGKDECAELFVRFRVRSFGVLSPQRQDADGLPVGEPLLRSATANTVRADAAEAFCDRLRHREPSASHITELLSDARRALGEPVATAVYREDGDVVPDCYDYVFVSTFTGAAVQDASLLTMADFEAEMTTPHLPVSCTLAVPCVVR